MSLDILRCYVLPFFVNKCRQEEVRDYIVTLCPRVFLIITQTYISVVIEVLLPLFLFFLRPSLTLSFHKEVNVPLDNISGIGILLVDRLAAERMSHLVIFRVADVVDVIIPLVVADCKSGMSEHVVHPLSVELFLQP